MDVRLGQTASDAWAVPDAVRLGVVRRAHLEAVRGYHPSAWVGAPASKAALPYQSPRRDALPLMVVYPCFAPGAVEDCPPPAVG
jgi:hypothetical protein